MLRSQAATCVGVAIAVDTSIHSMSYVLVHYRTSNVRSSLLTLVLLLMSCAAYVTVHKI